MTFENLPSLATTSGGSYGTSRATLQNLATENIIFRQRDIAIGFAIDALYEAGVSDPYFFKNQLSSDHIVEEAVQGVDPVFHISAVVGAD